MIYLDYDFELKLDLAKQPVDKFKITNILNGIFETMIMSMVIFFIFILMIYFSPKLAIGNFLLICLSVITVIALICTFFLYTQFIKINAILSECFYSKENEETKKQIKYLSDHAGKHEKINYYLEQIKQKKRNITHFELIELNKNIKIEEDKSIDSNLPLF